MRLLEGTILNRAPIVSAVIDKAGNLNLVTNGDYGFVVDTGFTGDLAVPYNLIPKLNLKFIGYEEFGLATRRVIELPVYYGWVKVKSRRYKVKIIPGDELLGMNFLEKAASKLIVDFKKDAVKLFG